MDLGGAGQNMFALHIPHPTASPGKSRIYNTNAAAVDLLFMIHDSVSFSFVGLRNCRTSL